MNRGTVIDHFLKKWEDAEKTDYIRKPFALALLETWKWVDDRENPREVVEDGNDSTNSENN